MQTYCAIHPGIWLCGTCYIYHVWRGRLVVTESVESVMGQESQVEWVVSNLLNFLSSMPYHTEVPLEYSHFDLKVYKLYFCWSVLLYLKIRPSLVSVPPHWLILSWSSFNKKTPPFYLTFISIHHTNRMGVTHECQICVHTEQAKNACIWHECVAPIHSLVWYHIPRQMPSTQMRELCIHPHMGIVYLPVILTKMTATAFSPFDCISVIS